MENVVCIENQELEIKEWNGQRVVTLADIDKAHQRPVGTAKRHFVQNKRHLIKNEDYYIIKKRCRNEIRPDIWIQYQSS